MAPWRATAVLAVVSAVSGSFVATWQNGRRADHREHGVARCPAAVGLDGGGGKTRRTFELCAMNDDGEIDECEVVSEGDLPRLLGEEKAVRVLNDPASAELFFGKRVVTKAPGKGARDDAKFTLTEWSELEECLNDEECEVPEDVLLKAMGPDSPALLEQMSRDDEGAQSKKPRFHLHFGAGRLGMGLVVPAISASGIPFAVVQRPKPKWIELFAQQGEAARPGEVGVSINSEVVVHNVEVLNPEGSGGTPLLMPPQSLIFGSGADELGAVVSRATSFSCSLGSAMGGVLVPLLSTLPVVDVEKQPHLFCCENDHDAVLRLKEELVGRVFVIDCMVDRVCTGRTISSEGVDVAAEPWRGSIVVLEPNLKGRLPFSSSVATAPRSQREAEYLSERKFSLVNGMHTVLAFMTLDELFLDDGDPSREYILRKYTKMPRDAQRMCEAWRTARVAQLLEEYGTEALMEWHDVSTREEAWDVLLSYADNVLVERFSLTDDVVSRVLGGGVANRWLTRLRPTDEWLAGRLARSGDGASEDGLGAFFAYAVGRDREGALERGCSLEDAEWRGCDVEETTAEPERLISTYLTSLTASSERFCTREVEITHKGLIKEQRKAGGKAAAPKVRAAKDRQRGQGI